MSSWENQQTETPDLLFHLPVLPEVQYVRLMKKYHIHKLVRILSGVLPKVINQQILEQMGYKRSDIEENRLVSEKATFELLPSEH